MTFVVSHAQSKGAPAAAPAVPVQCSKTVELSADDAGQPSLQAHHINHSSSSSSCNGAAMTNTSANAHLKQKQHSTAAVSDAHVVPLHMRENSVYGGLRSNHDHYSDGDRYTFMQHEILV